MEYRWDTQMALFDGDDIAAEVHHGSRLLRDGSRAKAKSVAYLRRLVEGSGGTMRSIEDAIVDFGGTTPRIRKSAVKFNGSLNITSKLCIPVKVYARTMEERKPTGQKLSWETTVEMKKPVRAIVETV